MRVAPTGKGTGPDEQALESVTVDDFEFRSYHNWKRVSNTVPSKPLSQSVIDAVKSGSKDIADVFNGGRTAVHEVDVITSPFPDANQYSVKFRNAGVTEEMMQVGD